MKTVLEKFKENPMYSNISDKEIKKDFCPGTEYEDYDLCDKPLSLRLYSDKCEKCWNQYFEDQI